MPLLLLFLIGLHGLVARRRAAGAHWSRLAMAAGTCYAAVTGCYAVLGDGVVVSARGITQPTPVVVAAPARRPVTSIVKVAAGLQGTAVLLARRRPAQRSESLQTFQARNP